MKTIGLIGGMSWESTVEYYRIINEAVHGRVGGHASAKILMYSVNFQEFVDRMNAPGGADWDAIAAALTDAATGLERAGADCVLICTNTMHMVAERVAGAIGVPLIHIAGAAASDTVDRGFDRVGLLGTAFTMEQPFYADALGARGVSTLVPGAEDRAEINRVVFDELCHGRLLDDSRARYVRIIDDLKERGAQAVVLGCTEIPLLVKPEDSPLPLIDTTTVHAMAAVNFALG